MLFSFVYCTWFQYHQFYHVWNIICSLDFFVFPKKASSNSLWNSFQISLFEAFFLYVFLDFFGLWIKPTILCIFFTAIAWAIRLSHWVLHSVSKSNCSSNGGKMADKVSFFISTVLNNLLIWMIIFVFYTVQLVSLSRYWCFLFCEHKGELKNTF